ncbi:MAG: hypothetical protein J1E59_05600 [Treponema sp.]|nr:hypothetical protein [Treponema sp.]
MRGVSLSFFKPSVFVKAFLVSCVVFSSAFFSSCKDLTSFDPNVDGGRAVTGQAAFSAPTNVRATNGYKRKISLEWFPVSGASYYEIWCATSSTAEFVQVGTAQTTAFDEVVSAGRTLYYKVRAVKYNGTVSAFSATARGTSLAQPVISGGEVNEFDATISWFMENARGMDGSDNYESDLVFEVFCQPKTGGGEIKSVTLRASGEELRSGYKHKFTNLAASTEYQFWVAAYITKDSSATEQSPVVDRNTLTSYMPVAPVFHASQGESSKGVWIYITLPEMVKVNTETKENQTEKQDVDYPLCFKITRKVANGDYKPEITLYYNGETTPPSLDYYTNPNTSYTPGKVIKWFDDGANSLGSMSGGTEYTYRIRSAADITYSKVVCPEDKQYTSESSTDTDKATTAEGWKSKHPEFKYGSDLKRSLSKDGEKVVVVSASFELSASWDDLGTAERYKFAIKQSRKPWTESESPTDSWLESGRTGENEKCFFDSLKAFTPYTVKFGNGKDALSDGETGIYTYTLYIVTKDATINDVVDGVVRDADNEECKVLDSVSAIGEMLVMNRADMPEADLELQDGYQDHVDLKIVSSIKKGFRYDVVRTEVKDGVLDPTTEKTITLIEADKYAEDPPETETFEYPDKTVDGNCTYYYFLKVIDEESGAYSASSNLKAEVLGTPKVSFDTSRLAYDSVTILFESVTAAERYTVTLGEKDKFGGGEQFKITKDGKGWTSDSVSASGAKVNVAYEAPEFKITIEKPYGYDNATLAGSTANVVVTAHSKVDSVSSDLEPVNVLGPADLDVTVNSADEAKADSVRVSWNEVQGASGYLVKRLMYSEYDASGVVKAESAVEDTDVVYYVGASDEKVLLADTGEPVGGASVKLAGNRFTLTDTEIPVTATRDDGELLVYQEAQAKISWGMPFRYVVLPVLDKGDFKFKTRSLALETGGKVMYKRLEDTEPAPTATLGYGLELQAEKSKNTTTQKLTWKKPYYAAIGTGLFSKVYKRKSNRENTDSNSFSGGTLTDANATTFEYKPEDDERYSAYEYIVKYNCFEERLTLPDSLEEELKKKKDSESTGEQANKGYLFTIRSDNLRQSGLAAKQGGSNTYAETVTWSNNIGSLWGSSNERALGPTGVRLYIRNNNLDTTWHKAVDIASLDYSGTITPNSEEDIAAARNGNSISVYPASVAGGTGTTSGALKVLRDYKHYYAIALTRGNVEVRYTPGFDDFTSDDDNKKVAVAYRQITIDEFTKAAIIGMSTGIYNERGTKGCNSNGNGIDGLKSTSSYNARTDYKLTFVYTNYVATHTTKSGNTAYAVIVNGTLKARGGLAGAYQNQYFSESNMNITYQGNVGTMYFNGTDDFWTWNKGTYPVNRTKGTINVTYGGKSKTYDMSKASENGWTLPFAVEGGYLNDSAEWQ